MNLVLGGWIALGLSSCGQKGPLYFAPEEQDEKNEKNEEKKGAQGLGVPRRHVRGGPAPARIASGSRESA